MSVMPSSAARHCDPVALEDKFTEYRSRVNKAIDQCLPNVPTHSARLHQAMRYATTNGGKCIRPILVYATGEVLGAAAAALDQLACVVELIHAYSLVHDDLPAMDDDDLRRSKPTCHKQFDEATAILAGDALQALAFTLLAQSDEVIEPRQRLKMITLLGEAVGVNGMAWGQAIDLEVVGRQIDLKILEHMYQHKTGALIRASVRLGALASPSVDADQLQRLDSYANAVGLAFQITDDILDLTTDTATLGKPQGSDVARGKPTYPALLGLDGSRAHARRMHKQALNSLAGLPKHYDTLRDLSAYIIQRSY